MKRESAAMMLPPGAVAHAQATARQLRFPVTTLLTSVSSGSSKIGRPRLLDRQLAKPPVQRAGVRARVPVEAEGKLPQWNGGRQQPQQPRTACPAGYLLWNDREIVGPADDVERHLIVRGQEREIGPQPAAVQRLIETLLPRSSWVHDDLAEPGPDRQASVFVP